MKSQPVLTCDCGCGETVQERQAALWLTLTQRPESVRTARAKLGHEGDDAGKEGLQFASFACLKIWTDRAVKVIPKMQREADTIYPRGGFYSDEFPTLWF